MSEHDEKKTQEDQQDYSGDKDRREHIRRSGHERRDMVRFEPDKQDRRSGQGRRKGEKTKWEYTI